MADNVAITSGTGTTIATDELTINAVASQVQRVKLVLGRDGTYTSDLAGRDLGSGDGALYVDRRLKVVRLQVTPVVSASPAYTAGDCLGPLQTVSSAVRVAGSSGRIVGVQMLDKTQAQRPLVSLVLFDRTVTTAADNAAFQCSDADMAFCLGVINLNSANYYNVAWPGTPLNSILTLPNDNLSGTGPANPLPFPIVLNGTDLFAQLVVHSTPTLTSTSDIVLSLVIEQD